VYRTVHGTEKKPSPSGSASRLHNPYLGDTNFRRLILFRDAAMLGKNKGMIIPGHFVQEEAGMRWAIEWLRPIIGETPATFVSAGDMFNYM
jgi:hypothetical protein